MNPPELLAENAFTDTDFDIVSFLHGAVQRSGNIHFLQISPPDDHDGVISGVGVSVTFLFKNLNRVMGGCSRSHVAEGRGRNQGEDKKHNCHKQQFNGMFLYFAPPEHEKTGKKQNHRQNDRHGQPPAFLHIDELQEINQKKHADGIGPEGGGDVIFITFFSTFHGEFGVKNETESIVKQQNQHTGSQSPLSGKESGQKRKDYQQDSEDAGNLFLLLNDLRGPMGHNITVHIRKVKTLIPFLRFFLHKRDGAERFWRSKPDIFFHQVIAGYGESRHIVFKYGQFPAVIAVNDTFFILGKNIADFRIGEGAYFSVSGRV